MIAEPVLFAAPPDTAAAQGASGSVKPTTAGGPDFQDALAVAMEPAPSCSSAGGAAQPTVRQITTAALPEDSTSARLAALQPQGDMPKADATKLAADAQVGIVETADRNPPAGLPEMALAEPAAAAGEPALIDQLAQPRTAPRTDDVEQTAQETPVPTDDQNAPSGDEVPDTADTAPPLSAQPVTVPPVAAPAPQTAATLPAGSGKGEKVTDPKKLGESEARPAPSGTKGRKSPADHAAPPMPLPKSPEPTATEPQAIAAPTRDLGGQSVPDLAPVGALTGSAPQAAMTATPAPTAPPPAVIDTALAGWETRFTEHLTARLSESGQSIEITLAPETLGPVTITVEMADGAAQVQIVTETPEAARLFQHAEHRLADSMAKAGLMLAGQDTSSRNPRDSNRDGRPRGGRGGEIIGVGGTQARIDAGLPLQRRGSGLLNIVA